MADNGYNTNKADAKLQRSSVLSQIKSQEQGTTDLDFSIDEGRKAVDKSYASSELDLALSKQINMLENAYISNQTPPESMKPNIDRFLPGGDLFRNPGNVSRLSGYLRGLAESQQNLDQWNLKRQILLTQNAKQANALNAMGEDLAAKKALDKEKMDSEVARDYFNNVSKDIGGEFTPTLNTKNVDYSNWANLKAGGLEALGGTAKAFATARDVLAETREAWQYALANQAEGQSFSDALAEGERQAKERTKALADMGKDNFMHKAGDYLYKQADDLNAQVARSSEGLMATLKDQDVINTMFSPNKLKAIAQYAPGAFGDNIARSAGEMGQTAALMFLPGGLATNLTRGSLLRAAGTQFGKGLVEKEIAAKLGADALKGIEKKAAINRIGANTLGYGGASTAFAVDRERERRQQTGERLTGAYDTDKTLYDALTKGTLYQGLNKFQIEALAGMAFKPKMPKIKAKVEAPNLPKGALKEEANTVTKQSLGNTVKEKGLKQAIVEPLKNTAKKVGTKAKDFKELTLNNSLSRIAGGAAIGTLAEASQEYLQTGLELDITNPDMPIEERKKLQKQAALVGAISGGAMGVGAKAMGEAVRAGKQALDINSEAKKAKARGQELMSYSNTLVTPDGKQNPDLDLSNSDLVKNVMDFYDENNKYSKKMENYKDIEKRYRPFKTRLDNYVNLKEEALEKTLSKADDKTLSELKEVAKHSEELQNKLINSKKFNDYINNADDNSLDKHFKATKNLVNNFDIKTIKNRIDNELKPNLADDKDTKDILQNTFGAIFNNSDFLNLSVDDMKKTVLNYAVKADGATSLKDKRNLINTILDLGKDSNGKYTSKSISEAFKKFIENKKIEATVAEAVKKAKEETSKNKSKIKPDNVDITKGEVIKDEYGNISSLDSVEKVEEATRFVNDTLNEYKGNIEDSKSFTAHKVSLNLLENEVNNNSKTTEDTVKLQSHPVVKQLTSLFNKVLSKKPLNKYEAKFVEESLNSFLMPVLLTNSLGSNRYNTEEETIADSETKKAHSGPTPKDNQSTQRPTDYSVLLDELQKYLSPRALASLSIGISIKKFKANRSGKDVINFASVRGNILYELENNVQDFLRVADAYSNGTIDGKTAIDRMNYILSDMNNLKKQINLKQKIHARIKRKDEAKDDYYNDMLFYIFKPDEPNVEPIIISKNLKQTGTNNPLIDEGLKLVDVLTSDKTQKDKTEVVNKYNSNPANSDYQIGYIIKNSRDGKEKHSSSFDKILDEDLTEVTNTLNKLLEAKKNLSKDKISLETTESNIGNLNQNKTINNFEEAMKEVSRYNTRIDKLKEKIAKLEKYGNNISWKDFKRLNTYRDLLLKAQRDLDTLTVDYNDFLQTSDANSDIDLLLKQYLNIKKFKDTIKDSSDSLVRFKGLSALNGLVNKLANSNNKFFKTIGGILQKILGLYNTYSLMVTDWENKVKSYNDKYGEDAFWKALEIPKPKNIVITRDFDQELIDKNKKLKDIQYKDFSNELDTALTDYKTLIKTMEDLDNLNNLVFENNTELRKVFEDKKNNIRYNKGYTDVYNINIYNKNINDLIKDDTEINKININGFTYQDFIKNNEWFKLASPNTKEHYFNDLYDNNFELRDVFKRVLFISFIKSLDDVSSPLFTLKDSGKSAISSIKENEVSYSKMKTSIARNFNDIMGAMINASTSDTVMSQQAQLIEALGTQFESMIVNLESDIKFKKLLKDPNKDVNFSKPIVFSKDTIESLDNTIKSLENKHIFESNNMIKTSSYDILQAYNRDNRKQSATRNKQTTLSILANRMQMSQPRTIKKEISKQYEELLDGISETKDFTKMFELFDTFIPKNTDFKQDDKAIMIKNDTLLLAMNNMWKFLNKNYGRELADKFETDFFNYFNVVDENKVKTKSDTIKSLMNKETDKFATKLKESIEIFTIHKLVGDKPFYVSISQASNLRNNYDGSNYNFTNKELRAMVTGDSLDEDFENTQRQEFIKMCKKDKNILYRYIASSLDIVDGSKFTLKDITQFSIKKKKTELAKAKQFTVDIINTYKRTNDVFKTAMEIKQKYDDSLNLASLISTIEGLKNVKDADNIDIDDVNVDIIPPISIDGQTMGTAIRTASEAIVEDTKNLSRHSKVHVDNFKSYETADNYIELGKNLVYMVSEVVNGADGKSSLDEELSKAFKDKTEISYQEFKDFLTKNVTEKLMTNNASYKKIKSIEIFFDELFKKKINDSVNIKDVFEDTNKATVKDLLSYAVGKEIRKTAKPVLMLFQYASGNRNNARNLAESFFEGLIYSTASFLNNLDLSNQSNINIYNNIVDSLKQPAKKPINLVATLQELGLKDINENNAEIVYNELISKIEFIQNVLGIEAKKDNNGINEFDQLFTDDKIFDKFQKSMGDLLVKEVESTLDKTAPFQSEVNDLLMKTSTVYAANVFTAINELLPEEHKVPIKYDKDGAYIDVSAIPYKELFEAIKKLKKSEKTKYLFGEDLNADQVLSTFMDIIINETDADTASNLVSKTRIGLAKNKKDNLSTGTAISAPTIRLKSIAKALVTNIGQSADAEWMQNMQLNFPNIPSINAYDAIYVKAIYSYLFEKSANELIAKQLADIKMNKAYNILNNTLINYEGLIDTYSKEEGSFLNTLGIDESYKEQLIKVTELMKLSNDIVKSKDTQTALFNTGVFVTKDGPSTAYEMSKTQERPEYSYLDEMTKHLPKIAKVWADLGENKKLDLLTSQGIIRFKNKINDFIYNLRSLQNKLTKEEYENLVPQALQDKEIDIKDSENAVKSFFEDSNNIDIINKLADLIDKTDNFIADPKVAVYQSVFKKADRMTTLENTLDLIEKYKGTKIYNVIYSDLATRSKDEIASLYEATNTPLTKEIKDLGKVKYRDIDINQVIPTTLANRETEIAKTQKEIDKFINDIKEQIKDSPTVLKIPSEKLKQLLTNAYLRYKYPNNKDQKISLEDLVFLALTKDVWINDSKSPLFTQASKFMKPIFKKIDKDTETTLTKSQIDKYLQYNVIPYLDYTFYPTNLVDMLNDMDNSEYSENIHKSYPKYKNELSNKVFDKYISQYEGTIPTDFIPSEESFETYFDTNNIDENNIDYDNLPDLDAIADLNPEAYSTLDIDNSIDLDNTNSDNLDDAIDNELNNSSSPTSKANQTINDILGKEIDILNNENIFQVLENVLDYDKNHNNSGSRIVNDEFTNHIKDILGVFFKGTNNFFKPGLKVKLVSNPNTELSGLYEYSNKKNMITIFLDGNTINKMSASEIYTHEVLHAITEYALDKAKIDPKLKPLLDELKEIQHKVLQDIRDSGLSPILAQELGVSEEVFNSHYLNYMQSSPSEFLAIALSNQIMFNYLKELKVGRNREDLSIVEKLVETFKKICNILFNTDFSIESMPLDTALLNLTTKIAMANNDLISSFNITKYSNAIWKCFTALDKITTPIAGRAGNALAARIHNAADRALESKNKAAALWVIVRAYFIVGRKDYELHHKAVKLFSDVLGLSPDNCFAELFSSMTRDDSGKTLDKKLKAISDGIDKQRNMLELSVKEQLKDMFKFSPLNADEEKMLVRMIKKTGLTDLSYDFNTIYDKYLAVGRDKTDIQVDIDRLEKELKDTIGSPELYNEMMRNINTLATYMTTGKVTGFLLSNTNNILNNLTTNNISLADKNAKFNYETAYAIVDEMITLKALSLVDDSDVDIMQNLAEARGGKEALKELFNYIKQSNKLNQEALQLTGGDINNLQKGYVRYSTNNAVDIKLGLLNDKEEMEKAGYELVNSYGYANNKGTPYEFAIYANKSGFATPFTRGTFRTTNDSSRGFSVASHIKALYPDLSDTQLDSKIAGLVGAVKKAYKASDSKKWADSRLMPIFDKNGYVKDFKFIIDPDVRDELGFNDVGIYDAVANETARALDKDLTKKANIDFVREWDKYYEDNKKDKYLIFIEISSASTDPKLKEIWDMLPSDTKDFINSDPSRGSKQGILYLRADILSDITGYKDFRITDVLEKFIKSGRVIKLARFLEGSLIKLAGYTRENIVLKNPAVMVDNMVSNLSILASYNIDPITATKDFIEGTKYLESYHKHSLRLTQINHWLKTTNKETSKYRALLKEKERVEALLNDNPMKAFDERGLIANIVTESSFQDDSKKKDIISQKIDKYLSRLPSKAQTIFNNAFVLEGTQHHRVLSDLMQYSDLLSRYSLYKNLKGKQNEADLWNLLDKSFINYATLDSRYVKYINDIGLFRFTKYFVRSQQYILHNMIGQKLGRFIAMKSIFSMLGFDLSTPMTSILPIKFSNLSYCIKTPFLGDINTLFDNGYGDILSFNNQFEYIGAKF